MTLPESPSTPKTPDVPKTPDMLTSTVSPLAEVAGHEWKEQFLTFKPETTFQVQIGVVISEVEEETIAADPLRNRYFRINPTGIFIWKQLKSGATFSNIVSNVAIEYNLAKEISEEVVTSFLNEVAATGLIVISTDGEQTERRSV